MRSHKTFDLKLGEASEKGGILGWSSEKGAIKAFVKVEFCRLKSILGNISHKRIVQFDNDRL